AASMSSWILPMLPTIAATAPAASVFPELITLSGHVLPTSRFPANTLSAAVAGPTPGGSKSTATRHGSAPRLTFCSGPILTGYFSARTTPTRQAGTTNHRHGCAVLKPPAAAATTASNTPAAGTPATTAFSGRGKVLKVGALDLS